MLARPCRNKLYIRQYIRQLSTGRLNVNEILKLSVAMDIFSLCRLNRDLLLDLLEETRGIDEYALETLLCERDDRGRTALHIAATYGCDETLLLLLNYGSDHTLQDWVSYVRNSFVLSNLIKFFDVCRNLAGLLCTERSIMVIYGVHYY